MEHAPFLFCLMVVAGLTAGAMGVRSASRIWLRHWAERRLQGAESVALYLERPQRLLAAANAGIALALGAAGLWIGWRSAAREGVAVATIGIYAVLTVLLGHIVPRSIARRWPAAVIPVTMPLLRAIQIVTTPLLRLGRALSSLDDPADHGQPLHDAMQDLLREGELEGVGRPGDIAIINGVMAFGEKAVQQVLTPAREVFAVPERMEPRAAAALIAESKFSRVPVYRDTLDHVVGMYHAFDILKDRESVAPALRPVGFAAADTPCNDLLFKMLRARLHMTVIQDGARTLGIVTLENLLEELVGDIRDEHDDPMPASPSSSA